MSEETVRPAEPALGVDAFARVSVAMLGVLLVMLPFERQLGLLQGPGGLSITGLEIIWALCLGAWALRLVVEQRLPSLTRGAGAALVALFVVNAASALTADGYTAESIRFVARSAAGWLLFVLVADAVANGATAKRFIACLLAGAAVSAAIGLVALALGTDAPAAIAGTSNVGSVARLQGSFNYANTAAMYWTATAICGVGLAVATRRRLSKAAVTAVVLGLVALSLLTLSRGAAIGVCGGLATSAAVLLAVRRRPAAVLTFAAAIAYAVAMMSVQLLLLPGGHLFDEGQQSLYGVSYEAPATVHADVGETIQVPVTVTNTGELTWRPDLVEPYSLGASWLDVEDGTLIARAPVSAPVTTAVAHGQSISLMAVITAPSDPGVHTVGWNMVTPFGGRFSEYGSRVLTTTLVLGDGVPLEQIPTQRLVELDTGRAYAPRRSELWSAAAAMVADEPLLGVGPGTFRLRYGAYLGVANADDRVHSNNVAVELAATTGLLGLGAFVVLVGYVVVRALRSARSTILLVFVLGALSAFFWAGLVDYFLGFMGDAGLFWALLGLGLGLATKARTVRRYGDPA